MNSARIEFQENEDEEAPVDDLDTAVPVEGDAVLDLDNEEPEEDISAPLVGDDPTGLDTVDQDEMAAVEETTVVDTEIEAGPSTPTDTDRRVDGI